MSNPDHVQFLRILRLCHNHFGPLHWWPADSPFEVVIGAILTQNTAWTNVEQAINNLKQADVLSPYKLACLPSSQLETLIRPSGFYRQKSARLKNLAAHLVGSWHGNITDFCSGPLDSARARLLALPGIGPETADSILLYAAERPTFVVDAYTRRVFERIGLLKGLEQYEDIRRMFMQNLPVDARLFNEYHAQIVQLAKTFCRKSTPLCSGCPLSGECRYARQERSGLTRG